MKKKVPLKVTRRNLIWMLGWAAVVSAHPTAVFHQLKIPVASKVTSAVSTLLSNIKIYSTFDPVEWDMFFNDSARQELLSSKEVFFEIFWKDSQLLQLLNLDKSTVSPTNINAWTNILHHSIMTLVFDLPQNNTWGEHILEVTLWPSDFWVSNGDSFEWYWYLKSGNKTYNISRVQWDTLTSLKWTLEEIIEGISNRAVNSETWKPYTQEVQDKQLPILQTEFSELMDQILSWKIEITDEVKQKVWVLLSS